MPVERCSSRLGTSSNALLQLALVHQGSVSLHLSFIFGHRTRVIGLPHCVVSLARNPLRRSRLLWQRRLVGLRHHCQRRGARCVVE